MSTARTPSERRQSHRTRRRRAALLGVLSLLVLGLGVLVVVSGAKQDPRKRTVPPQLADAVVDVRADGRSLVRLSMRRYVQNGRVDEIRLQAALRRVLPQTTTRRFARARVTYQYDARRTARRVAAIGDRGGEVDAARSAVAAVVSAPVLQQARRNTCESAALEILSAAAGRRIAQGSLQAAFPRSGPLDPRDTAAGRVWGDPDRGYVGRSDGGGVAGGFGVYPGPVRATARRFGVRLDDVSGQSPAAVYGRLLRGRAVMVWVALSDGPYGRWLSPLGKEIEVNFGEHTVVLHGIRRDGRILVSNPLEGTREIWTKQKFEAMWDLLGRRALAA